MTEDASTEPARAGNGWTDDDHNHLVDVIREGLDLAEVADRLQRTRGSIRSRARRLAPVGALTAGRHGFDALRSALLSDPAYDWKARLSESRHERFSNAGSTGGATIGIVGVVKRSVSLEAGVAERVEAAAHEDGMSFSTWLSFAAERQLLLREGLQGVSEWEEQDGPLSDEERADGEILLDRLLAASSRESGSAGAAAS